MQHRPTELSTGSRKWLALARTFGIVVVAGLIAGPTLGDDDDRDDTEDEVERMVVIAPNYISTGSRTATKSDTSLRETPQSVTVISRDQIELLHWTNLEETMRYTAGAIGEVFGPDTRYDWLLVRGFNPVQYIDGLQAPVGSVANVGTDLYGYSAVDVLKGPSSVLYGQTPPGGIVNMTSRRPEHHFHGELGAQVGNFSRKEVHGDLNGPLGERAAGRMTFLYRDTDTQVDFTNSERLYLAPALSFDIAEGTDVTFLAYYQSDAIDNHSTGFLPASGTLLPNPHGEVPVGRNLGEPGVNFYDRDQYGIGYEFSHEFRNGMQLEQNFKYFSADVESREVYGTGLVDSNFDGTPDDFRTVNRSDFPFNEEVDSFNVDTRLYNNFRTGEVEHAMLVGLDYRDYRNESEFGFAEAPPIDLFNPVYGAELPDPDLFPFTDQKQKQTGLYLQDRMRFDRLVLTLSGRYDRLQNNEAGERTSDREFTYRVGANYLFDNGWAPYIQTATSFQAVPGSDFDGNAFTPSTGRQFEAGVKYENDRSGDWRMFGSGAVYRIVQQDVLTPDPDNQFFSVQTGEITVEGVEFEAVARFQERISFNASYTYTDAVVTESNAADLGKQVPMIPRHKLSMLADYGLVDGPLAGLGFNLGARYLSATYGDPANDFRHSAMTLFDASARYDMPDWRFAVTASNLTDKEFVARCDGATNCFFGSRRSVIASVTRRF